jgi:hypothetical protein
MILDGLYPANHIFHTLLKAAFKLKQYTLAFRFAKRMEQYGVLLDWRTCLLIERQLLRISPSHDQWLASDPLPGTLASPAPAPHALAGKALHSQERSPALLRSARDDFMSGGGSQRRTVGLGVQFSKTKQKKRKSARFPLPSARECAEMHALLARHPAPPSKAALLNRLQRLAGSVNWVNYVLGRDMRDAAQLLSHARTQALGILRDLRQLGQAPDLPTYMRALSRLGPDPLFLMQCLKDMIAHREAAVPACGFGELFSLWLAHSPNCSSLEAGAVMKHALDLPGLTLEQAALVLINLAANPSMGEELTLALQQVQRLQQAQRLPAWSWKHSTHSNAPMLDLDSVVNYNPSARWRLRKGRFQLTRLLLDPNQRNVQNGTDLQKSFSN